MLLIGIDEAGYGPKLGPLCHGYAVFRCGEAAAAPDLWALLHPTVMRHPASAGSITVDDSKKVYSTELGLGLLAQGVSAFLESIPSACETVQSEPRASASGKHRSLTVAARTERLPACDGLSAPEALYQRLLPEADRARLEEDPWGQRGLTQEEVPRSLETGSWLSAPGSWRSRSAVSSKSQEQRAKSPPLSQTLRTKGLSILALGARALSAKHFNAALRGQANKAEVSWSVIASELRRLLALCADGEDIQVVIDRQGGRKFYAAQLGALFPGALPWAESEEPEASVYRIEAACSSSSLLALGSRPGDAAPCPRAKSQEPRATKGRSVRVAFLVNAESISLPVALASMAAKLARELCMAQLNVFFKRHIPDLEPTAGYALDARRFLRETKAVRKRLGMDDSAFVRIR